MTKMNLLAALQESLERTKGYVDSELAKKADKHNHPYVPTTGGTLTGPISVSGESRFYTETYTDPWTGINCAIKATGNIATTGTVKAGAFSGDLSGHATSSTSSNLLNVNNTEVKTAGGIQFFQKNADTTMMPDSEWWSLVRTQHRGYENGYWQEMAYSFGTDTIKFRRNVNGTLSAWKTIAFAENTIPLSGTSDYSITGNLLFSDSGNTSGAFRGIQGKNAANDYWRCGGSQTASNAGYVEIATGDDSTEPIYARQYSGAFASLVRTATLLDESGNTSFPGTVAATSQLRAGGEVISTSPNAFRAVQGNYGFFIRNDGDHTYFMLTNSGDQYGNWNDLRPIRIDHSNGRVYCDNGITGSLSGNASTATKLATARNIALSGHVTGNANFDGSGNITIATTDNTITTITKSLKVTSDWMDTGIRGNNLSTGTYVVQLFVDGAGQGGQWTEYYSGIMSWFNGGTNSGDADEIFLHKAGHATNGKSMYLRTIRESNGGYVRLQIATDSAFTAAVNLQFKFKKLI